MREVKGHAHVGLCIWDPQGKKVVISTRKVYGSAHVGKVWLITNGYYVGKSFWEHYSKVVGIPIWVREFGSHERII